MYLSFVCVLWRDRHGKHDIAFMTARARVYVYQWLMQYVVHTCKR